MFDISWGELVLIGIVALIVIGPKELPTVLRSLGQWAAKIRRMASEFQSQFQDAMREAEVAELKRQFDEAQAAAQNIGGGFDPLETARREIETAVESGPAKSAEKSAATSAGETPPEPAPAEPAAAPAEQAAEPATSEPSPGRREAGSS
jgi:sec-independent protein translocase protein TatB